MEPLRAQDPAAIGPYRLEGRLGAGGMGLVYAARSPGGRRIAVKVIRAEHAADPGFRERFAREVEAARRVGGFHTAPIVAADPEAALPWMATAYIDGPSLADLVRAAGPLPVARCTQLARELAEGLAAIHACGLVHRDLKPGNLLMAADGVRIIDFGIASASGASPLTATGMAIGTFAYMSPEQVAAREVGPAADVFSLGAVLTFAATGHGPFDADGIPAIARKIADAAPELAGLAGPLRRVVMACLAKAPEDRPTAAAVLTLIDVAEAESGIDAETVVETSGAPATVIEADVTDAEPGEPVGGWSKHGTPGTPPTAGAPGHPPLSATVDDVREPPPGAVTKTAHPRRRRRRSKAVLACSGAAVAILLLTLTLLNPFKSGSSGPPPTFILSDPTCCEMNAMTFAPHGATVAIGDGADVYLWNTSNGTLTATISTGNPDTALGYAWSLAITPDGEKLVVATGVGLELWNAITGKFDTTFYLNTSQINAMVLMPGGGAVAVADDAGDVSLVDLATGGITRTLRVPDQGGAASLALAPNGETLAVGTAPEIGPQPGQPGGARSGGHVYLWNTTTWELTTTLTDPGRTGVACVAFSPDGETLAEGDNSSTGSGNANAGGHVYLWNAAAGKLAATLATGSDYVSSLAYSPSGETLAAGSLDDVDVWDTATGKLSATLRLDASVDSVEFSPDGKTLAASDNRSKIYVWHGGTW